jgi:hypothetical protein
MGNAEINMAFQVPNEFQLLESAVAQLALGM